MGRKRMRRTRRRRGRNKVFMIETETPIHHD